MGFWDAKPLRPIQLIANRFYEQGMGCMNCGQINWWNISTPAAKPDGSWRFFRRCRHCHATARFKAVHTGEGWNLIRT